MTELVGTVDAWRATADRLLDLAEHAGPLTDERFRTLTVDGRAGPEAVENDVDQLLAGSELLLDIRADQRAASLSEAGDPQSISVLLGNLEVGAALLTASQPPETFLAAGLVDRGTSGAFDDARARLAELHLAILAMPPALPATLQDGLTTTLDALQDAGAGEIVELAKSPTIWAALGGFVGGVAEVGGPVVREALDIVKGAVQWLQRGAVRIIGWVIDKLKQMVPKRAREKIDALVGAVKEKLAHGAAAAVSDIVGERLGRPGVEKAWQAAAQSGTAEAEELLTTVTGGHLARIGWVSSARTTADKFSVIIGGVLITAAPEVNIVVGALALAVFAFVGYEVWDGFNDIEALV